MGHHQFITELYEVKRTFGFKFSGQNHYGEHDIFLFRLEIVKYAGQANFSPLLWEVNPMLRSLRPSAMPLPADLARPTEEETLRAALEYINAKGTSPSAPTTRLRIAKRRAN